MSDVQYWPAQRLNKAQIIALVPVSQRAKLMRVISQSRTLSDAQWAGNDNVSVAWQTANAWVTGEYDLLDNMQTESWPTDMGKAFFNQVSQLGVTLSSDDLAAILPAPVVMEPPPAGDVEAQGGSTS